MEKNCQKRRQPPITNSVFARLMGLDELPHQRPLHKYQRVLSDGYICKSASIGLRQGSSVFSGGSKGTNNEMLQGVKDASGVQIYMDKNHFVPDKYTHKSTTTVNQKPAVVSLSKSTSGASHEDRKEFVRNSEHHAPGNVLRYLQKPDNDSSTNQFHGLATGYTNDFFTFLSDMTDKPSISHISNFKPKLEKTTYYCGVTKLDLLSRSENRESLRPESENHIDSPRSSFIDRDRTTNRTSRQQRRRSRPASKGGNYIRNMYRASLPSHSGFYYYKNYSNGPRLLLYNSYLGQETLKKRFERRKIEKEIEKTEVHGRGQTHAKMEAYAMMEPTQKYLNMKLGRNGLCTQSCKQNRNLGSTSSGVSHIKVWENDHIGNPHDSESETIKESLSNRNGGKMDEEREILKNRSRSGGEQLSSPKVNSSMTQSAARVDVCFLPRKGLENNSPDAYTKTIKDEMEDSSENDRCREIELGPGVSRSNLSFQCRSNDALADVKAFSGGAFSKISGDLQPESSSGLLSVNAASSSYSQEAFSGEASLNEFRDEESGYSNCFRLDTPEFQEQLDGPIRQRSPASVLESFDTQYPSTFECFENIGQQSQLQVLSTELEEAYSEGSEMIVSGNEEEKEEGIGDLSYNSGKVQRWLGDDKSRSFCYLVDVLDEAGCFMNRSIMDIIKSWDCLEPPINPLVFEVLEKKYSRQACWQKSDRQLLFDLINSELAAIIERLVNFHARATSSQRRWFISGMKRNEVEDMLWKMVIRLEREKSRDASDKVVEGEAKWWEVDDEDTNIICRELEVSLFEELVMESISSWNE